MHQAYLLILDKQLTISRLPRTCERILDVGSGPGDWAIAMGEQFPRTRIIATDISVRAPANAPQNVLFQLDDASTDWTYQEPFDYIHMRGLSGAFTNWTAIYAQAFRHLKENGILELADFGTIKLENEPPESYLSIFNAACQSAATSAGITIGLEHLRKQVLESSGLRVSRSTVLEVPLGTWSPDRRKHAAGRMALIAVLEGIEAMSLRLLTRELEWGVEEVRELCESVRGEIMVEGARPSCSVQFVVARKISVG